MDIHPAFMALSRALPSPTYRDILWVNLAVLAGFVALIGYAVMHLGWYVAGLLAGAQMHGLTEFINSVLYVAFLMSVPLMVPYAIEATTASRRKGEAALAIALRRATPTLCLTALLLLWALSDFFRSVT